MGRREFGIVLAGLLILAGCRTPPERLTDAIGPLAVTELVDADASSDIVPVVDVRLGEPSSTQPSVVQAGGVPPRQFNVLVLSGGGAYGAYAAGVLTGLTEAKKRPDFDVVTGVSTGALIASVAFLGSSRDADLKRFYTTITDDDVYVRRSDIAAFFSDSLADSKPLERKIEAIVDEAFFKAVAEEHKKGRRLYVGTTHLDARRLVVWDMGAIAMRGTPGDLMLFRRVLLASAAIPGFFPPVPIPTDVNGKTYEELHVDGGVTASLFFRPPQVNRTALKTLGERPLANSNLYIIVAGKLYADPGRVDRRLLPIVEDAISALLYAQTRGDLFQLFALCQATGMHYRLTSLPADIDGPRDGTSFNPKEMTRLFNAGRKEALGKSLWRSMPPGGRPGEDVPVRGGTKLTTVQTVPRIGE